VTTGGGPVYRCLFVHPQDNVADRRIGHSSEMQYFPLLSNGCSPGDGDRQVSEQMVD
jgi:hypothetical protein